MTHRPARLFLLFAALPTLTLACAQKPDPNSFGGKLQLEGGEVAKIGEDWNAGQQQIADGRRMIEKGDRQIAKGKKQIASGEENVDEGEAKVEQGKRMIAEGERLSADAERRYQTRIAAPPAPIPALPPAN